MQKRLSLSIVAVITKWSLPSTSHVYVLGVCLYYIYSVHSVYLCSGNRFIGWWEELEGGSEFLVSV